MVRLQDAALQATFWKAWKQLGSLQFKQKPAHPYMVNIKPGRLLSFTFN